MTRAQPQALIEPETRDPAPDVALAARLFEELERRTAGTAGVTRASYGAGEALAHEMVRREGLRLGLRVETDHALNLYLTLPGRRPGPRIVIGSHLDSVPCGGNFDGAAGVLAGLAVAAGIIQAGVSPPCDLTIMAIRAEESVWFNASYIGSRAAFGLLQPEELDGVVRSDDGLSLAAHVTAMGGDAAALRRREAFLQPQGIAAFIEPHIEQGPELIDRDASVGIVTGIRGSFRYRSARAVGAYAHSGATPRRLRQDAVIAAARLGLALDDIWSRREAAGEDLAITLGQFSTDPREHGFSKVAGRVDFSIDVRSQSEATLESMRDELGELALRITRESGVSFTLGPLTGSTPARMNARIVAALTRAAEANGCIAPLLPCGAGHDAAVFAAQGVPTGMLFIRNANGSHNPAEAMSLADFAVAAGILMRFCLNDLRG